MLSYLVDFKQTHPTPTKNTILKDPTAKHFEKKYTWHNEWEQTF